MAKPLPSGVPAFSRRVVQREGTRRRLLAAARKAFHLAGAGLDGFLEEPTEPDYWRGVPNVILSPHMVAQTVEAMARLREAAACNLKTVLTGSPVLNELVS